MQKKKDSIQKLLIPTDVNKAQLQPYFLGSDGSVDKSIIDELDSDVVLLDKDLNIVLMNKTAELSYGVSLNDVEGSSYMALRLMSIEQELSRNLNNVIMTKKTFNIRELKLTSPENVTRFFDQSCAPIFDKDGSIQGIISISKDVTQRVSKEILYQESKKMLKDLTLELDVKEDKIRSLKAALGKRYQFHNLIGKSYLMQNIYNLIDRVSPTDSTILITGETGTGKELVARAIHYNSLRKDCDMVAVNCAALPETLLESELFGHVKGAFTGAIRDKKGKFELADKGTIFLDEIGELSTLTQVKLLRVLQERQIERVGGEKTINVDIRIIAATNQDLLALIEKGKFRKDLFYRLNIITIRLPLLKERADDVPLLVDHFIEIFNNRFNKNMSGITPGVLRKLMSYSWPGNIRELEGVIEKAVLLEESETIENVELSTYHSEMPHTLPPLLNAEPDISSYYHMQEHLDNIEKEYFINAFKKHKGKISDIAEYTGLNRRTILNKMKKFSIKKNMFKQR